MYEEEFLMSATWVIKANKITSLRIKNTASSRNASDIIEVCKALKDNTSIQYMDFGFIPIHSHNEIDFMSAIAEMLEHNSSIKHLYLGGVYFGRVGVSKIAKALEKNKTLERLSLSHAYVGDDGAIAIANMFKVNQHLKEVELSDTNISDVGATALAKALKDNTACRKLGLCSNYKITIASADAFIELLTHNPVLEELDLHCTDLAKLTHNPDLGFWGGAATFFLETLSSHLANLVKINVLQGAIVQNGLPYDVNYFEGSNVTRIVRNEPHIYYLIRKNEVDSLTIEEKSMDDHVITRACEALRNNTSIKYLSFFHCENVTDTDVSAIAEMLEHNSSIKHLYLGGIVLSYVGVSKIAKALEKNKTLERLSLSHADIRDDEAIAIANMLKVNQHLKAVEFRDNKIGDTGAIALAKALKDNTSCSELGLSSNYKITIASADAFIELLTRNSVLEELNLQCTDLAKTNALQTTIVKNGLPYNVMFYDDTMNIVKIVRNKAHRQSDIPTRKERSPKSERSSLIEGSSPLNTRNKSERRVHEEQNLSQANTNNKSWIKNCSVM